MNVLTRLFILATTVWAM